MYKHLTSLLFKIPPETAHNLTITALKYGLIPANTAYKSERLKTDVCGLSFDNPVGLAAGFDKNGESIAGIFKLGFGMVEIGTVTPKPQDGNPKPRIFRDSKSHSVINRMGFPNAGLETFLENVSAYREKYGTAQGILGINIGMNKDQAVPEEDYVYLIEKVSDYADYLTVNVSSPNTPGLRDLQAPEHLEPLLKTLVKIRDTQSTKPPLFVKLAPDLIDKQLEDIVPVLLSTKVDGCILTNTTLERPETLPEEFRSEKGGLSGALLKKSSTDIIAKVYKLTKGKLPLIGVGGIESGQDAFDKIKAGASLVQLYTGLVYHGPALPVEICKKLDDLLDINGYSDVQAAVGTAHKEGKNNRNAA